MGAAGSSPPRLSDEELQELVAVLSEADSAELKLTVPDEDQRATVELLGLDPLDAVIRQVYSSIRGTSRSTPRGWWSGGAGPRESPTTPS